MGDLNAKVGVYVDNQGKESIMGSQGLRDVNDNGDRLATFRQENRLVIEGTIFEHKNIDKVTLCSPDGHTQNQIATDGGITTDGGVIYRMSGQDGEHMLEVTMFLS